jgi:hypothetical protein
MYAPNGIAASLGTATQATPLGLSGTYSGSTDTWGVDGFRASFGRGNPVLLTTHVCATGSTDIYGADGFLVSFASSVSGGRIDLAQACQGAATVSR